MRKRILWIGDSPSLHTGYGVMTREILCRLHRRGTYDLACLGWFHREGHVDASKDGYAMYATLENQPGSPAWDPKAVDEAIESFRPDLVVTLGNLSSVDQMPASRYRRFITWIGYFPIEGRALSSWRVELLRSMDQAVTLSQFGKEEVALAVPEIDCQVIPPGVDLQVFRPLSQARRIRERAGLADRFVVGCVARNHRRKQLPVLIEAFSEFHRLHRRSVLYLHADPYDYGWNLLEIIEQFGVQDCTLLTEGLHSGRGVPDRELNELYNLFDVMVLPSMAEGFGLPILESMAAGTPVVATGFSAPEELLHGRGELLQPMSLVTEDATHTELAITSTQSIVASLERLYRNKRLREEYRKSSRAFALQYNWDRCARNWGELLDRIGNPLFVRI